MTGERDSRRGRVPGVAVTLALTVLVIAADQISKAIVVAALGPGGDRDVIEVIPGFLRLFYVENTGAAFGMLQGNSPVLTVLAAAVVIVLAIAFRRLIAESVWLSAALGLQFGGAMGNIIDRLRHGFVVDFIDVSRWPTFNLADSAITVGVVILGYYLLRGEPAHKPKSGEGQSPVPAGQPTGPGGDDVRPSR